MSTHNLEHMFRPRSVALVGASAREGAIGHVVMRNLIEGGFAGPILPINPKAQAVHGVLAYADVAALPIVPDLAVVGVPPQQVPQVMRDLAARGVPATVVLTAGLGLERNSDGRTLQEEVIAIARDSGMRMIGPNCVGLLVPPIGLNASFAHRKALPGKIAFVSQSGALCTAVIDWACTNGIGFSHFISMGDSADVDFGDVIDYLGTDPDTSAILLYIESIADARKFISAARAASRNKPILAIKAGRSEQGAKAAASHTGALAGADHIYDAALARAGILRVRNFEEIFEAAATLAHSGDRMRKASGDRLAILTNGGGIGVLAVDALAEYGGKLADLTPDTVAKLDAVLPPTWSHGNPADIIGDAPALRYTQSLDILLDAPEVEAVLVMHCPVAVVSASEVAKAVTEHVAANTRKKPVSACWVGAEAVWQARRILGDSDIPSYDTPEKAVRAYMHLVKFRRNQDLLMETPSSIGILFQPDVAAARAIIARSLAAGGGMLDEHDAKAVLAAYGIPVASTRIAATPDEAAALAAEIGCPAVLKILSDDISHKSDAGGVALDLASPEAVRAAALAMNEKISKAFPQAKLRGFTVQRMIKRSDAHELIVGVSNDGVFGPVILFGQGGTAVEVIKDRAVTLPPLNMHLAQEVIGRTRVSHLLAGYRDRPPADINAVAVTLCHISQLVTDIAEVVELDINPLLADANGVMALDARIRVAPVPAKGRRLAIRPYPKELEEQLTMADGREVLLRPIRPEDEPAHQAFHARLDLDDIRMRHFGLVKEIPHSQMARLTQLDYDREMAFIAVHDGDTLGVVRVVIDPNGERAEFAIIIRSDLKGLGLGRALFGKVVNYCRHRGVERIVGQTLRENKRMTELALAFGFEVTSAPDGILELVKVLKDEKVPA